MSGEAKRVDLFEGGPPPWISKRDPRHPARKPDLYAEVLGTPDRALLCSVAVAMIDEAAGGPVDVARFISRVAEAAENLDQQRRVGELLNRADLHDLAQFFGRVRERRAQFAESPAR